MDQPVPASSKRMPQQKAVTWCTKVCMYDVQALHTLSDMEVNVCQDYRITDEKSRYSAMVSVY